MNSPSTFQSHFTLSTNVLCHIIAIALSQKLNDLVMVLSYIFVALMVIITGLGIGIGVGLTNTKNDDNLEISSETSTFSPSTTATTNKLKWKKKSSYPGPPRHHPITFSNATHGFLLTGSSKPVSQNVYEYSEDFYIYNSETDTWTESNSYKAGTRSFGYGVVQNGFASEMNLVLHTYIT